jgi:putative membrane protein
LILHIEKTIPLENIQDLSFIGGPILRSFGLTMIRVETAGGGGQHNQNMMSMIGINDAEIFKKAILNQREKVINEKRGINVIASDAKLPIAIGTQTMMDNSQLLIDIKNELIEIKKVLNKNNS